MSNIKEGIIGKENTQLEKENEEANASMMDSISAEHLGEEVNELDPDMHRAFYNAFLLLQKKNAKKKTEVDEKDIPMMLRAIGLNPLEPHVERIILQSKKTETSQTTKGYLDYQNLERTLANILVTDKEDYARHSVDTILSALRVITPNGEECLEADYFKRLLMGKGICFSEEEADKTISKALDKGTGKIWLDDFAEILANDGLHLFQSPTSTTSS